MNLARRQLGQVTLPLADNDGYSCDSTHIGVSTMHGSRRDCGSSSRHFTIDRFALLGSSS